MHSKVRFKVYRTRILVVDDHEIVRRNICRVLSDNSQFDVICEAASGEEAVVKAREHLPDLVILDIILPGVSGIEAARQIRQVSPQSRILFLSQHTAEEMITAALGAGGHGYLLKSDVGRELLNAIRTVQGGGRYLSKVLAFSGEPHKQRRSRTATR
jgi:DNA-binding NarL/FixJ family response regulator